MDYVHMLARPASRTGFISYPPFMKHRLCLVFSTSISKLLFLALSSECRTTGAYASRACFQQSPKWNCQRILTFCRLMFMRNYRSLSIPFAEKKHNYVKIEIFERSQSYKEKVGKRRTFVLIQFVISHIEYQAYIRIGVVLATYYVQQTSFDLERYYC
ncbi:unnamed protein product [Cylicocyclus nassatus]|uniref:Uncharacterized protein n=1 Tax=Cylicocyclus nassatus TaxID=53992 RepID=A0AA36H9B3_CYLNA|nr:unnamed protein product [Cylicocyclus nassatus]